MIDYKKIKTTCGECGNEFECAAAPPLLAGVLHIKPGDPISTLCPKCGDSKRQEQEAQDREREKIQREIRSQEWLRMCGIPLRFWEKSFDNYKPKNHNQEKTLEVCRHYAEGFKIKRGVDYHSLVLFSIRTKDYTGNGNGKTHLVSSIAHYIIDNSNYHSLPVIFIREPDLFSKIRSTYNQRDGETELSIMERLTRTPLLIVDDVGKEETSDPRFVQRIWYSIIERRYSDMLPIVLTANLDPDKLNAYFGGNRTSEATFDRLYEMCGAVMYELIGRSHRQEITQNEKRS